VVPGAGLDILGSPVITRLLPHAIRFFFSGVNSCCHENVTSATAMNRRNLLARAGALASSGVLARIVPFPLASSRTQNQSTSTPDLDRLLSLFDFESAARARISHGAWERISGGAADELTLRWNRDAYDHIRLKPRILVDVSKIDTRVDLFGQELPFPILLAPTGGQRFIHPEGEIASARGAAAANATYVISSSSSFKVEDIARSTKAPVWFQLYVQKDRAFTRDLVQRAEDSGCRALCVTVDSPTFGARNREERAKNELPERELPNLKGKDYLDPGLTWKDIDWLRSFARTPVLLKGVLNPDDALTAVKAGTSGIIVSNHGARNLDTVPATIDALPLVAEKVAGRIPVLVDGGIRRGTDILKAFALGASAVQIGRPYLWGLGVSGAEGVTCVVGILRKEFALAMALTGRPTIASIDRSVLW
jgi:4-hydroxymandelate oxidase